MMKPSPLMRLLSYLFKPIYGGIGQILMFHRVCQQPPNRAAGGATLEVSPEILELVIRFFKQRAYSFISLDELYDNMQTSRPVKKFVVFTFDDGYIDNFTNAYPALKAHNIPFTVYIATSFPDRTARLWWYAIDDLFAKHPDLQISFDGQVHRFDCRTVEGKQAASTFIRRQIKSATTETINTIIKSIFTNNDIHLGPLVNSLAMSWQQIIQLSSDPLVTIGAHTVDHFVLSHLSDKDLHSQIDKSRQILADKLGTPIFHFAYPYGNRNEAGLREFNLVKELGFKTGVTSRFANIFPAHRRHLESLPRIEVPLVSNPAALTMTVNGIIQARKNRFQRIVTV